VMHELVVPMWRPDRTLVGLKEILELIPENELVWSFFEFEGVGEPPAGLMMDELESLAQESSGGYVFSWVELTRFAVGLNQVINCFLAAVRTPCNSSGWGKRSTRVRARCFIFVGLTVRVGRWESIETTRPRLSSIGCCPSGEAWRSRRGLVSGNAGY